MDKFPEITLRIERMAFEIKQALVSYGSQLQERIDQVVKEQIATYDFDKEVREQADIELKKIVGENVRELFDYDTREGIRKMVKEYVVAKINKAGK